MKLLQEPQLIPYEVAFLPGNSWLCLAPHPDDETFGCGATLALARQQGVEVQVAVVTDGAAQGEASVRRLEVEAALGVLGVERVSFWDFPDRGLAAAAFQLVRRLKRLLATQAPHLVLVPSPMELHPDHRALAWSLQRALRHLQCWGLRRKPPFWVAAYEVSTPFLPNVLVDVTGAWPQKEMAAQCYRSQLEVRPYQRVAAGLAAFRRLTVPKAAQVEAFHLLPSSRLACHSLRWWRKQLALGPMGWCRL